MKRVSSYGTLSSREGSRHGPEKPAGKPPFDRGTPHDPPPPGAGAALMKIFGGGGGQSGGGDVSSAGRHFRSAAKAVMAANRFVAAGQKRVQWERTTAEGRPIIDAPGRRPVRRSKNFRSAAKAVIAANRFGSFGADDRVPLRGQFDEPTPEEIRDFERHGVPIPKHKHQNDARGEAPPRGGARTVPRGRTRSRESPSPAPGAAAASPRARRGGGPAPPRARWSRGSASGTPPSAAGGRVRRVAPRRCEPPSAAAAAAGAPGGGRRRREAPPTDPIEAYAEGGERCLRIVYLYHIISCVGVSYVVYSLELVLSKVERHVSRGASSSSITKALRRSAGRSARAFARPPRAPSSSGSPCAS